jgi:hypothetical protein
MFPDDDACINYLIKCRWPSGFVCPKCNGQEGWWIKKVRRFECKICYHQTSPIAGTIMHGSHLPIHKWFWAAYLVSTLTPGISATQIQRQLGMCEYRTAWYLLHRLRQAMVNKSREPLVGLVEVDETYIGGPAKGYRGRGVRKAPNKSLVIGVIEVEQFYNSKTGDLEERAGRVRFKKMSAASGAEIENFLFDNVLPGSIIKSDGWASYSKKIMEAYEHVKWPQDKPSDAKEWLPHIHRAFGNLQTWLRGTHHGVDPKHLQTYMEDFTFRTNRRQHPMASFRSLLGIGSTTKPLSFKQLSSAD